MGVDMGVNMGIKMSEIFKYIFVKMDENIVLHVAVNIGLNRCVQTC